jgi:hypothetical protein
MRRRPRVMSHMTAGPCNCSCYYFNSHYYMQTMRMDQAQDTNARFDGVWPEWQGRPAQRYRSVSAFHRKPHLLGDDKSMQAKHSKLLA